MTHQNQRSHIIRIGSDERGVALMTVMILTLMTGVLGVAALTMTGWKTRWRGLCGWLKKGPTRRSPVWAPRFASSMRQ